MDERALTNRRIGLWSAAGVVAIWMVFAIVGVIGVVARPGADPLNPVEPFLAIFEVLIVLAAMVLVVMMASVHTYAPPDRKNCSLAALAFMSGGAVLTSNAHFAALTVGRQIDAKVFPWLSRQFAFGETWPSLAKAMDLLAWDVFVGLSLLLAATAFRGDPLQDRIRIGMIVGGMLCLIGTLGPLTSHMQIQYLGIAGYAFVLPAVCLMLAMLFARAVAGATH